MNKLKVVFSVVIAALLISSLSSCSPAKLDVSDVSAIIDIRTADDFAAGHIVGAINNDYSIGDFIANATSLNRSGKYYVYGKNESDVAKALDDMFGMGFVNVTNIGSYEDAQRLLPLGVTK